MQYRNRFRSLNNIMRLKEFAYFDFIQFDFLQNIDLYITEILPSLMWLIYFYNM